MQHQQLTQFNKRASDRSYEKDKERRACSRNCRTAISIYQKKILKFKTVALIINTVLIIAILLTVNHITYDKFISYKFDKTPEKYLNYLGFRYLESLTDKNLDLVYQHMVDTRKSRTAQAGTANRLDIDRDGNINNDVTLEPTDNIFTHAPID